MAELITIETEAVYKATNGKYLRLRGSTAAAAEVHRWVGYIKQSDVYTLSECGYIVEQWEYNSITVCFGKF